MNEIDKQLLDAIKEIGVAMYKMEVLVPAVKKLLNQCVYIEAQLIAERSTACCNFRDLRLGITDLLSQTEDNKNDETN